MEPGKAFDRIVSFYPYTARRFKDSYVYGVDFNTLAASAPAAEMLFTIDRDSDFVVLAIAAVHTTDATGSTEQTFPEVLMQVRDSGSGANWFNSSQHMGNVTGRNVVDGAGPFILQHPRWVNAGSQVAVILQNLEANARRVWISFHGAKIYRGMRPMPGSEGAY